MAQISTKVIYHCITRVGLISIQSMQVINRNSQLDFTITENGSVNILISFRGEYMIELNQAQFNSLYISFNRSVVSFCLTLQIQALHLILQGQK